MSAQAINFYIQWTGGWYTVNGTSASTPSVASVFAMLDDELVAAGKPPLGWLNPLIYANPQAFNDITSGSFLHLFGILVHRVSMMADEALLYFLPQGITLAVGQTGFRLGETVHCAKNRRIIVD